MSAAETPDEAAQSLPPSFAETLHARRVAARLSKKGLARLAGLSLGTIRNLERGTTYPTADTLARLFRVKPLRLAVPPLATGEPPGGDVPEAHVCHGGEQLVRLTVEMSRLRDELSRLREAVGLPAQRPRRRASSTIETRPSCERCGAPLRPADVRAGVCPSCAPPSAAPGAEPAPAVAPPASRRRPHSRAPQLSLSLQHLSRRPAAPQEGLRP